MTIYAFDKHGHRVRYEIFAGDFVVDDEKESVAKRLATISNPYNQSYRNCRIGKIVKEFKGGN